MKIIRLLIATIFIFALLIGSISCIAVGHRKGGHKTHKGWNKNSNNPHHPNSTNPGHSKKKHNNKDM